MSSWRRFLLPLSWVFGGIVNFRNALYDYGLLKSTFYHKPIIAIGNIRAGGTGKTPFTEFLVDLLSPTYSISILSRGYGRRTKGFLEVNQPDSEKFGDEPSQFKSKFPHLKVYVSERRRPALEKILKQSDVILLDDAFQHRRVRAGMNWVLMEFEDLGSRIRLFPAGNFRERLSALNRAQALLITKCPEGFSSRGGEQVRVQLRLKPSQALFFSSIQYLPIKRLEWKNSLNSLSENKNVFPVGALPHYPPPSPEEFDFVLVFSGIANPKPFQNYLERAYKKVQFIVFPDHHEYSESDIRFIQDQFNLVKSDHKMVLTTEKDAQRMNPVHHAHFIDEYPVYFQPIRFQIEKYQTELLKDLILQYVKSTL